MSTRKQPAQALVFGLSDWVLWLESMSQKLFGMTAADFERARFAGTLVGPAADDLGSVLPLIQRLRLRENGTEVPRD